MKIKYHKIFPHAALLERFDETGKRCEYTLTAGEDAVVYPIQSAGHPSLIRTGIAVDSIDKEGAILFASFLPSIIDHTGLILLNPYLVSNGEIILRVANLARTVQTIQKGVMLASLSVLTTSNADLEFVEATAQKKSTKLIKKRKD